MLNMQTNLCNNQFKLNYIIQYCANLVVANNIHKINVLLIPQNCKRYSIIISNKTQDNINHNKQLIFYFEQKFNLIQI